MKLALLRRLSATALAGWVIISALGCASTRDSRLLGLRRSPTPQATQSHVGAAALASQTSVQPASAEDFSPANFSEERLAEIRMRHGAGVYAPPGRNCFS